MRLFVILLIILTDFTLFSYGFTDVNLHLTDNPQIASIISFLQEIVRQKRIYTAISFSLFIIVLSLLYLFLLKSGKLKIQLLKKVIVCIACISLVSIPATSYDLFNYILTAKTAFYHHENPYVVMPFEIENETNLQFTRAANKLALYGPVWILETALPHFLGFNRIWLTIIAFKALAAFSYLITAFLIYRLTKSSFNLIFFTLNPLVINEVLFSGHNDLFMMLPAVWGIYAFANKKYLTAVIFYLLSILTKAATIPLILLIFIRKRQLPDLLNVSYWIMMVIFVIGAPIREELYPWYLLWVIPLVSILNLNKYRFIKQLTIMLSIVLLFRHVPYMVTGDYGGIGPIVRKIIFTAPLMIFLVYYYFRYLKNEYHIKNNS